MVAFYLLNSEFIDEFVGASLERTLETRSGTFIVISLWTTILPCVNCIKSSSFSAHLAFFYHANM